MKKNNLNPQNPKINTNGYNGSEPTRKCPKCLKTKPLSEFGFRQMDKDSGVIRNQSYCTECRGKY